MKELDSSETMVSSNVNWWTAMEHKDKTRRVHDAEFKAKVLGECRQPGASIAAVALRHGLNANVVRQWLAGRGVKRAGLLGSGYEVPAAASAPMASGNPAPVVDAQFVALALPAPDRPRPSAEGPGMANPSTPDIHIEWRSGAARLTVSWPAAQAQACAAWLCELAAGVTK